MKVLLAFILMVFLFSMLISDRNNRVLYIKGIDPTKAHLVSGLPSKLVLGNFDLSDVDKPKIGVESMPAK